MASIPQPWDWLKDWRSKDDKMSRWMWKVVKDKTDEARIVEAEGKGTKKRKDTKKEEERV